MNSHQRRVFNRAVRRAIKIIREEELSSSRNHPSSIPMGKNRLFPNRETRTPKPIPLHQERENAYQGPRLIGKLGRFSLEGIALLSGLIALYGAFYVQPKIRPPIAIDRTDLFRLPFSISNDNLFFTFYNVYPLFYFPRDSNLSIENMIVDINKQIGNLPPNSP
jgi:hypothetical protein